MSTVISQHFPLSKSGISIPSKGVIQHKNQAYFLNSYSMSYTMNESQGPIRYSNEDYCYNTNKHGNIIEDMGAYQPRFYLEQDTSNGAMLNKDNRRRRDQSSTEPRTILEPLLAREPTAISDRTDGLHRPIQIALSPPTTCSTPSNLLLSSSARTSFSASNPLSLSLSTSLSLSSFSFIPQSKVNTFPLSTSQPPSTNQSTCYTIHSNMPLAAISHACSQTSNTKHQRSSLQYSSSPSVLASSLQTVRYASEQGMLLAQKSKTSLNRLLDSVMDNATTLSESNSRHENCDNYYTAFANSSSTKIEGTNGAPQKSTPPSTIQRPSTARNHSSKTKLFVCGDDSEEDEDSMEDDSISEDQQFHAKVRTSTDLIDYYHGYIQASEQLGMNDDMEEDEYFGKTALFKYHQVPLHTSESSTPLSGVPEMGRRQSLLSDLFMAEKLLGAQKSSSSNITHSGTTWKKSPMYPSPSSSLRQSGTSFEGEGSFPSTAIPQQLSRSTYLKPQPSCQTLAGLAHQSIQSSHHQYQHFEDRMFSQEESTSPRMMANHERAPKSPLRRTKKSMFKNLDELVGDIIIDDQGEKNTFKTTTHQDRQPNLKSNLTKIISPTSEIPDCKTAPVTLSTLSPALAPKSATSPIKRPPPHSILPSPSKACRCSPATATTKTAFATVSATSKCSVTASSVSSAVTAAAAVAANTGVNGDGSNWTQIHHFQTHLQSLYGHLSSSIQKAISTSSSTTQ